MSRVLDTPRPSSCGSSIKANSPKNCDNASSADVKRLKSELKRVGEQRAAWQTKCTLLEERVRRDAKRIQSLEVLSKQEPKLTHADENKYLKEIDILSSKVYKLDERNQSLMEEIAALKVELRNRKKDYEASVKDIQSKHERNTRSLTQMHKNYADGFTKDMRKEAEELRHILAVQETDLHKQYQRHMQDIKAEASEREMCLKEVIRKLQDTLHSAKISDRRDALRGGDGGRLLEMLGDDALLTDALLDDHINESPLFSKKFKKDADNEENTAVDEEDPDECY